MEEGAKRKRDTITPELPDGVMCDKILIRLSKESVFSPDTKKNWNSLAVIPIITNYGYGEIVFQESGLLFCYDHRTDQKTHTLSHINWIRSVFPNKCFSYMLSLLLLEGMKATSQTPHTNFIHPNQKEHRLVICNYGQYILKISRIGSFPKKPLRMKVKKAITAAGGKRARKLPAELSEELIRSEILIRLPIKSVTRFKSVCKSWLSLFSDPRFVKKHYTRSTTETPNEYDCLIAEKDNRIVILSRYKETLVLPTDKYYQLVGSIHGIVCLRRNQKLSLWNPAICQSKELTLAPHHSGEINSIGLGFDPVSDDYKVVVSVDSRYASVYSFKSNSWTDLFVPANLLPKSRFCDTFTPTTIVKNCPYWTTCLYATGTQFISYASLKFDAGSNEFKLLPKFRYERSNARGKEFKFLNMKDCLTLMVYKSDSLDILMDVYSLDEEGCGVWTKMYTLGPLNLHKHGHLSQGFMYGGEIVFDVFGKLFCFDYKTDTFKRIQDSTDIRVVSCYGYTPSLVFLPGMKSVYSQTQTRTHGLSVRTPRRLINSLRG